MYGTALLLTLAQTDQFQNFPADYQTRCAELGCASRPVTAGLPAHYPSHALIISVLHRSPKQENPPGSSVATPRASRTTPSISRWWYSHLLVQLYHLIRPNVEGVERPCPRLPARPTFLGALQNHPVMLIRRYVALGCTFPWITTRGVPSTLALAAYPGSCRPSALPASLTLSPPASRP